MSIYSHDVSFSLNLQYYNPNLLGKDQSSLNSVLMSRMVAFLLLRITFLYHLCKNSTIYQGFVGFFFSSCYFLHLLWNSQDWFLLWKKLISILTISLVANFLKCSFLISFFKGENVFIKVMEVKGKKKKKKPTRSLQYRSTERNSHFWCDVQIHRKRK